MIDYHTSHEAALGSLKTEQSAKTYADVQDGNIPQYNLSGNEEICFLGKKTSQNKQSIMESLILAQDERWRRA